MSAAEIAKRHFSAAIAESEAADLGHDSVCRTLLGWHRGDLAQLGRCTPSPRLRGEGWG